jgi:transposase-like protein
MLKPESFARIPNELYGDEFRRQIVQEYLSGNKSDYAIALKHNIPQEVVIIWTEWHRAGEPTIVGLHQEGSGEYFRDRERSAVAEYYRNADGRLWRLLILLSSICSAAAVCSLWPPPDRGFLYFIFWLFAFLLTWGAYGCVVMFAWVAWHEVIGAPY